MGALLTLGRFGERYAGYFLEYIDPNVVPNGLEPPCGIFATPGPPRLGIYQYLAVSLNKTPYLGVWSNQLNIYQVSTPHGLKYSLLRMDPQ